MGLSRKRERELKKLKRTANDLWEEQLEVLEHAGSVAREAGRQVGNVSREEVVPRVRDTVDHKIKPAVSSSIGQARHAFDEARNKVSHDLLPGVSASVASAIATLESAKDPRVRDAMRQLHRTSDRVGKSANKALGEASKNATKAYNEASKNAAKAYNKVGTKVGFVHPPKKSMGVGGYFLIVIGVVAVVGLAYAAWQTLRADDELWVVDEDDTDNA